MIANRSYLSIYCSFKHGTPFCALEGTSSMNYEIYTCTDSHLQLQLSKSISIHRTQYTERELVASENNLLFNAVSSEFTSSMSTRANSAFPPSLAVRASPFSLTHVPCTHELELHANTILAAVRVTHGNRD